MKKKRKFKSNWILIILILILGVLLIWGYFRDETGSFPRDGGDFIECIDDSDCAPRVESYCTDNETLCNYTTYYVCANLSGPTECVPSGCKNVCNVTCKFGCQRGECLEQNLSDLIIYNITNLSNSDPERISLAIFIKNIGLTPAPETITQVLVISSEQEFLLNTFPLLPGQITSVEISYMQPVGTVYQINASADYGNSVEESNEENNKGTILIEMPPY